MLAKSASRPIFTTSTSQRWSFTLVAFVNLTEPVGSTSTGLIWPKVSHVIVVSSIASKVVKLL